MKAKDLIVKLIATYEKQDPEMEVEFIHFSEGVTFAIDSVQVFNGTLAITGEPE